MPMRLNWARLCILINLCFIFYTSGYVLKKKKMFYAGKCHRRQLKKKHEFPNKKPYCVFVEKGSWRWEIKMLIYKLSRIVLFSSIYFYFFFPAVSRPFGHARKNILPDQIILHNLSWFTMVPAWGIPGNNV